MCRCHYEEEVVVIGLPDKGMVEGEKVMYVRVSDFLRVLLEEREYVVMCMISIELRMIVVVVVVVRIVRKRYPLLQSSIRPSFSFFSQRPCKISHLVCR